MRYQQEIVGGSSFLARPVHSGLALDAKSGQRSLEDATIQQDCGDDADSR